MLSFLLILYFSMNIFVRWIINVVALVLIARLVPGIELSGWYAAFIVALILGIINVVLKPILLFLTLPLNIITLGLFTLVINGLLFWFAASIVKGFDVGGFYTAFLGALLMSLINIIAHSIFKQDRKELV